MVLHIDNPGPPTFMKLTAPSIPHHHPYWLELLLRLVIWQSPEGHLFHLPKAPAHPIWNLSVLNIDVNRTNIVVLTSWFFK